MNPTPSEQTFDLDDDEVEAKLDLNPNDALFRFSSYRDYDPEADLSYSDLDACNRPEIRDDELLFVLPGYLSGSDYICSLSSTNPQR